MRRHLPFALTAAALLAGCLPKFAPVVAGTEKNITGVVVHGTPTTATTTPRATATPTPPPATATPGASPTASPVASATPLPKPSPTGTDTTVAVATATPTPSASLDANVGVIYDGSFASTVLAGGKSGFPADGTGTAATLGQNTGGVGLALESVNTLLFTDAAAHQVRLTTLDTGAVSRAAGEDGTAGVQVRLGAPGGLANDPDRRVAYFTDGGKGTLRRVYRTNNTFDTTVGKVDQLAGVEADQPAPYRDGPGVGTDPSTLATFNNPTGLAKLGDVLYVADTGNHTIRAVSLTRPYTVSFVAGGKGEKGRPASGSASEDPAAARFDGPTGLAMGGTAARPILYVADTNNHCIRAIDLSAGGKVTVYAGKTLTAGGADGAAPGFNLPVALAIDGKGALYVGERGNFRVRRIATDGTVATLGGRSVSGTKVGARDASLFGPIVGLALSLDPQGAPTAIYAYDVGPDTSALAATGARLVQLKP